MVHAIDHEMVDKSTMFTHPGHLSLEDDILKDVLNDFIAK